MSSVFGMIAERTRPNQGGKSRKGRVGGAGGTTNIGDNKEGIQLHRRMTRRQMTLGQLAAWRVKKILENFPDTTSELRERYYAELAVFDQIQTMNAELLAASLMLLFRTRDQIGPEVFANNQLIMGVLNRMLPNGGNNIQDPANDPLLARYKADLLRYVRAILFNRQHNAMETDLFLNPRDEPTGDDLIAEELNRGLLSPTIRLGLDFV